VWVCRQLHTASEAHFIWGFPRQQGLWAEHLGHNLLIPTRYLYAQTNGNLGFRLSYVALGVIVVAQFVLLWTINLGRSRWFLPVGVEVVICLGFSLATYRLLRGYEAVGVCTGAGNCAITYPSPLTAVVVGLFVGVMLGAAWRRSWKADQRQLQQNPRSKVPA
jgi:hypothetical protein